MFILGLTGSIAMGKSTTARLFAEEGVPVYDADAAVHRLYEGEAAPAIEAAFPGTTSDGKVDRAALGQRVVGDARGAALSGKHRASAGRRRSRDRFLADAEAAGAKVVGARHSAAVRDRRRKPGRCGGRWSRRRPRCSARACCERGMPPDRLEALLARQMPDAEKRRRADFVVDTGHGIEPARAAGARNPRRGC